MFKKIQKYLLINHPLLWNTKVVPLTCFLIAVNIVFFIIGYLAGNLDFTETERAYRHRDDDVMFFFGVFIAIITGILWFVYYFKNNGFKSFYPKNNFSLFKEWAIIVLISFLLCSINLSYMNGIDTRVRGYCSEKEAVKKCQMISKASIFYGQNYDAPVERDSTVNDTLRTLRLDHVLYNGKKYPLESLINKDNVNFSFFDERWDSLTKIKVKDWLVRENSDSVKALMKDYFKLIKAHNLTANINENEWFSIVYNPPSYLQSRVIGQRDVVFYNENFVDTYNETGNLETEPYDEGKIDSVNQYMKIVNNVKYVYNRKYLPADQLEYNYGRIATAYTNPSVSFEDYLVMLYFTFGLSIIVFSFRVTSGRNWLIALISMGVLNVLLGIFSAVIGSEYCYLIGLLLLTVACAAYFGLIVFKKTTKGISGIALNCLLWLLLSFIPIAYSLLLEIFKRVYGYYDYDYRYLNTYGYKQHPTVEFMKDNLEAMGWLNLLFVALIMLLLSIKIKQWKGIAEN